MDEPAVSQFFDETYIRLFAGTLDAARTAKEVDGLWALAGLATGARVLDAPCGFGRLSRALAERGAHVLGVDLAGAQIEAAERGRGAIDEARLRYRRHDLRVPLDEGGFDAALNVFSSIGYGSDDDDAAIVRTLGASLRPGGRLVVETNHRDLILGFIARGVGLGERLDDGTLVVNTAKWDPATSRCDSRGYWWGPNGHGEKRATLRIYAIHELIALVERAGLRFLSLHSGCSPEPYRDGQRVAVLAERGLHYS